MPDKNESRLKFILHLIFEIDLSSFLANLLHTCTSLRVIYCLSNNCENTQGTRTVFTLPSIGEKKKGNKRKKKKKTGKKCSCVRTSRLRPVSFSLLARETCHFTTFNFATPSVENIAHRLPMKSQSSCIRYLDSKRLARKREKRYRKKERWKKVAISSSTSRDVRINRYEKSMMSQFFLKIL